MWFDALTAWAVSLFAAGIQVSKEISIFDKKDTSLPPPKPKYPEPHRNNEGKIVIENSKLYNEDIKNHTPYQVSQWIKQGKYNLEPEELERTRKEFMEEYRKWMYKK